MGLRVSGQVLPRELSCLKVSSVGILTPESLLKIRRNFSDFQHK